MRYSKYILYLCVMIQLLFGNDIIAQVKKDSVKVHFRQGYSILDTSYGENASSLCSIIEAVRDRRAGNSYRLNRIEIVGAASPEGTVYLNNRLSYKRANVLFNYIDRHEDLPDSMRKITPVGRDWRTLILMVEEDPDVPYKNETLAALHKIANEVESGNTTFPHMSMISTLRGGKPYKYMYEKMFPALRASKLYLWYDMIGIPELYNTSGIATLSPRKDYPDVFLRPEEKSRDYKFFMSIRTNMLYDALLVPNVGVDMYLGKNWSLAAYWHYAWWDVDPSHVWWRTYGGDVEIRKWFGKKSKEKPLTGHHIGPYAQMVTYDFELGGRGYLGDKWSYGAGLSYGYSHPIGRRLNIDFTLGLGYLWGEYKEYIPIDNCYVWQATKQRSWIGPTKAEISLVWQVGRGNENKDKGGWRW